MVYDTSVPDGPSITTGDYPAADDDDPADPAYDGVGRYGTFSVDAADTDVVKYCWGVNVDPVCDGDHTVATTGGSAESVSFRPTRSGTNFLYVQAFDGAGNGSQPNAYEFRVKAGQPTRAQWKLDDGADATAAKGTAGARTVEVHGGAALGAAGVVGTAANFDGVDDYLQSDIPTVHTDTGFAVAAWVKLDSMPTGGAVVVAQPGNYSPGFELYYSKDLDRWVFAQYTADTADASPVRVMQATSGGVKTDEWVHLVGAYDSTNDVLKLYVNGALAGTRSYTTPWDARRGLVIGAGSFDGQPDVYFPGTIDDVRIYDKPLTVNEVNALREKQPLTGRPARAIFPLDEPVTDDQGNPTSQVTGRAEVNPAVFQGGAEPGQPGVNGNALSLDGADDYATTTPHLNNQRDFSVVAWAKLSKTKPDHAAVIAAQTGTTKPGFELYYSATYGWSFNQYSSDDSAGTPQRAAQGSASQAAGGVWTQVGGSYDAHDNYLRLYVQGQYVARVNFAHPFYAGGPLQIGASAYGNGPGSFFPGQIADVQLYDRALSAPEMAELFDDQTSVEGRWKLDAASGTPATSADDLVREDHTTHPLTLGSGASIDTSGSNNMIGTGGLLLNGTSTGYATTTTSPIDTSTSFTASAWVTTPSRPQKPVTVMSMAGANTSGFAVRYVPDSTDPATAGRWQLVMADADSTTAHTATAEDTNFQNNTSWNHLAVVYDAAEGQMRLYADGQLQTQLCADDDDDGNPDIPGCTDAVSWNSSVLPFNATKGLQLGRIKTGTSSWGEYWPGVIDDVWLIQGAATDTQIGNLARGDDLSTTAGP